MASFMGMRNTGEGQIETEVKEEEERVEAGPVGFEMPDGHPSAEVGGPDA